jgi:hypothetical protein
VQTGQGLPFLARPLISDLLGDIINLSQVVAGRSSNQKAAGFVSLPFLTRLGELVSLFANLKQPPRQFRFPHGRPQAVVNLTRWRQGLNQFVLQLAHIAPPVNAQQPIAGEESNTKAPTISRL